MNLQYLNTLLHLNTLLPRGRRARTADPKPDNAGPWPCLPGCEAHRHHGDTGDDPLGECVTSVDIGTTELTNGDGVPLKWDVSVYRWAAYGVLTKTEIVLDVDPPGACGEGMFVLTLPDAQRHLAHLQQAVEKASAGLPDTDASN